MGFTSKLAKKAIFRHSLLSYMSQLCLTIRETLENTAFFQATSKTAITHLD